MYQTHEGEILLKEKHGSNAHEISYVNPPDQKTVVILDENKTSNINNWLAKIFLPHGYPNSVSADYIAYQVWDTAQAFCSTITGILSTQEVFRSVGVGDTNATPLAATVTWVIKDGCGHLGKIIFAFTHGTYLDAYSKKWRLYADTLNDAAMCIEIALPLFKNYTTFVLCISTVMKAIVGVAGGATRAAMTQHHAVRGNMADVSAKDAAQETAVNLFASFAALLILTIFGNSLIVFVLMMILHIVFNYLAVRAVCLRTLNEPRFLQLIDLYLSKELIATPCEINRNEPIIFYNLGSYVLDFKLCGFQIKMGQSIKKLVKFNSNGISLKNIKEVYECRNYMLMPNINNRTMYVFIKEEATTDNILRGYFHAVLLSVITSAINEETLAIYHCSNDGPFAELCHTLQAAEWTREVSENEESISGFVYNPSVELMKYLDNIVHKEWDRIRDAITFIGWDLSKHLLIVDEWRIAVNKNEKKFVIPQINVINEYTRTETDGNISSYEDEYEEANSDEILKLVQYAADPERTKHHKESGKLRLETGYEPAPIQPEIIQAPEEPDNIVEPFVTQAESSKRHKKKD